MAYTAATRSGLAITTTVETIVVASPAVPSVSPGNYLGLSIRGVVNVTTATGSNFINVICYRGASINAANEIGAGNAQGQVATASNTYQVPFFFLDTALVPGQQYVITVAVFGSTGSPFLNYAYVETDLVVF